MTMSASKPRLTVAQRRRTVADWIRMSSGSNIATLADYLGVSTRTVLTDIIAMPELHGIVGGVLPQPAAAAAADPCGNVVPLRRAQ